MRKHTKLHAVIVMALVLLAFNNIFLFVTRTPFINFIQQLPTLPTFIIFVQPEPTIRTLKEGDNVTVNSLSEAQSFMRTYNLSDLSRITLTILYDNFTRRMPLFIRDKDRQLFMLNELNRGNFDPATRSLLRGEVNVVRNGTFAMPYDCGWKSSVEFVRKPRQATRTEVALCPLLVPDSFSFQVFVRGSRSICYREWLFYSHGLRCK